MTKESGQHLTRCSHDPRRERRAKRKPDRSRCLQESPSRKFRKYVWDLVSRIQGRIDPMDPVFLLNSLHSAHVGLWLSPDLACFGKEVFKSRWSDIDKNADWLIRIIFETVDRAAG